MTRHKYSTAAAVYNLECKCFVQRVKLCPETWFDQEPQSSILKRNADSKMDINMLLSKQSLLCGCDRFFLND